LHVKHLHPLTGIFAGAGERFSATSRADIILEGWGLFPFKTQGTSKYRFQGDPVDIPDTGRTRRWSLQSCAWSFDAMISYLLFPLKESKGLTKILGVRYDYYDRKLEHDFVTFLPQTAPGDILEVRTNIIIPYVGFDAIMGGENITGFARILGSPLILGDLTHKETFGAEGITDRGDFDFEPLGKGYWAEILLSAYHDFGNSRLGAFMRMTTMSAYGESEITTSHSNGATEKGDYTINHRKLYYIVGLKGRYSLNILP
jgi:hypothetical protein